ncbi:MAG TPA: hypothetical protein VF857_10120, partial [Spirochaetota bacterium]
MKKSAIIFLSVSLCVFGIADLKGSEPGQSSVTEGLSSVSGDVSVSRIKVEIDEEMYIWNPGEPVPTKSSSGFTSPATVLSFVDLKPGETISLPALEREVYRAEIRLTRSHFFYDVSVQIIPPLNAPQKRTIYIKVNEGFLYRFGGGNAYGMFGKDNISGTRKSFRIYAGYNLIGGQLIDDRVSGTNAVAGVSQYYRQSDDDLKKMIQYRSFETTGLLGYRFTP